MSSVSTLAAERPKKKYNIPVDATLTSLVDAFMQAGAPSNKFLMLMMHLTRQARLNNVHGETYNLASLNEKLFMFDHADDMVVMFDGHQGAPLTADFLAFMAKYYHLEPVKAFADTGTIIDLMQGDLMQNVADLESENGRAVLVFNNVSGKIPKDLPNAVEDQFSVQYGVSDKTTPAFVKAKVAKRINQLIVKNQL